MSNKKTTVLILLFAIVATLLTLYRYPELMMGPPMSRDLMYTEMGSKPMMGGWQAGSGTVSSDGQTITFSPGEAVQGERPMSEPAMGMMMPGEGTIMPRPYYDDALTVSQRSYMHSAFQGVLVADLPEYMRQVKEYLQSNGGVILHVSQYTSDDIQYAYLDGKIPAEKFDEATSLFASRARKVMTQSINSEDVTGQQKMLSDQVAKLQGQRSAQVTALTTARTEAERQKIQAMIDMLDQQIKAQTEAQMEFAQSLQYATITITASDSEQYFDPENGGSIEDQSRRAVRSLKGTARLLGVMTIWIAVYAVIWLPIILAARWLWRKLMPQSATRK